MSSQTPQHQLRTHPGRLSNCDNLHPDCAPIKLNGDSVLMQLKCIDCLVGRLVEIGPNDTYLALSYVWGSPLLATSKERENPPKDKTLVLGRMSQVIKDAVTVVQNLGKRYLWVDKYCIDQEDANARHFQIRNMDRIYAGAYATIVENSSKNANWPFRSWWPFEEASAVYCHFEPMFRIQISPLPSALKGSVWLSRGWRYQEAILSRRCLFFTNIQVYFICAEATCCEAVMSGREDKTLKSSSQRKVLNSKIFDSIESTTFQRYISNRITQYSSRNLSFGSDA